MLIGGYVALNRQAAQFLFQLVSLRYQRGRIILTRTISCGERGDILSDQALPAAVLDRLLHSSTMLNIRGPSRRLRERRKPGGFTDFDDAQPLERLHSCEPSS